MESVLFGWNSVREETPNISIAWAVFFGSSLKVPPIENGVLQFFPDESDSIEYILKETISSAYIYRMVFYGFTEKTQSYHNEKY